MYTLSVKGADTFRTFPMRAITFNAKVNKRNDQESCQTRHWGAKVDHIKIISPRSCF